MSRYKYVLADIIQRDKSGNIKTIETQKRVTTALAIADILSREPIQSILITGFDGTSTEYTKVGVEL